jgi:hypothetical protein
MSGSGYFSGGRVLHEIVERYATDTRERRISIKNANCYVIS